MTPAASRRRATLAGFAAVLLWSSLAVLTTATGGIPPFQLLALGFGIAGVSGVALLLRPGGPGLGALRQPMAAGALGIGALFGYHALYFIALKRAPAVEANLINYLWPLLIVVFAALIGGVAVRPAQWLGTALGLAAAVLLVTRGGGVAIDPAFVPGIWQAKSACHYAGTSIRQSRAWFDFRGACSVRLQYYNFRGPWTGGGARDRRLWSRICW